MSFPETPRPEQRKPDTSWRWWIGAFGLLALLWWFQPEYGFNTSDEGQTVAPPLDQAEAELEPATPEATVEATPESESEKSGLHGVCVSLESGEPLPGFTVRLSKIGLDVIEDATDDRGRFELPGEFEVGAKISVLEYSGWSDGLAERELTVDELSEAQGIVLRVPTAASSFLRGRVLDSRTGRGLAKLSLQLSDVRSSEVAHTDASGRFASVLEYIGEATVAVVFDQNIEAPLGSFPLNAFEEMGRIELIVDVGPTIGILAEQVTEGSASNWQARIIERRGDPKLSGRIAKTPSGWALLKTESVLEERMWSSQTLRSSTPTWIRYARFEYEPAPEFVPALRIQSLDGKHVGETALNSTVGVQREPIPIVIRETGSLSGEVRDSDSTPIRDARIWLRNSVTEIQSGPWQTSDMGTFSMENLEVGSYELTVIAPSFPKVEDSIDLVAGKNALPVVTLPFSTTTHEVRGRFECRLAHSDSIVLIELEAEHGHDKRRQVLRRVSSQKVSNPSRLTSNEFVFKNLPAATYALSPIAISGKHRWMPDLVTATTPVQLIRFRCAGDGAVADLRVEAVDADSGRLVPGLELYFGPVKQPPFTWPESRPVERWYTLPIKSPLSWTAWAPGYQPSTGTLGDRGPGKNSKPLQVELKRGFGLKLELLGIDRGAASNDVDLSDASVLPGIEISIDGERYGTSDQNGELLLRLDRVPKRIDLLHPRWQVERIEDQAGPLGQLPSIRVWLRPR
ncbi:MAG: hypothetical protein ACI87A_001200 [Planctomycetota bacterium]